jgi:hypothetical protein
MWNIYLYRWDRVRSYGSANAGLCLVNRITDSPAARFRRPHLPHCTKGNSGSEKASGQGWPTRPEHAGIADFPPAPMVQRKRKRETGHYIFQQFSGDGFLFR